MKKVTMILAIIVVILALIILTINLYVKEITKKQIINNSDYTYRLYNCFGSRNLGR